MSGAAHQPDPTSSCHLLQTLAELAVFRTQPIAPFKAISGDGWDLSLKCNHICSFPPLPHMFPICHTTTHPPGSTTALASLHTDPPSPPRAYHCINYPDYPVVFINEKKVKQTFVYSLSFSIIIQKSILSRKNILCF